ncbi:hypothetical protein [Fusobacterium necrophorum]|uniref:hypothetical protein n=1 Tax=Fusobacterium necrophorum TaxID=859 RepID=UPI0007872B14|nr:hypothetical protein [Fusobacterium necrophorum]KYM42236.1 hypothetical protein A2U08_05810 [Fusobacterium necrophorum subsp. funduliforme]
MEKEKEIIDTTLPEDKKKNKKSIDEKIQELKTKLKSVEQQKKELLQRKGVQIWKRMKPSFFQNERILYDLLEDEEKMALLVNKVEEIVQQLFPDYIREGKNDKESE